MRTVRKVRRFLRGSLSMADLTETLADLYGDDVALHLETPLGYAGAHGDRLTYREMDELTRRFSAALAASGVGAGERVAILTSNGIDVLLLSFAVMRLGAVAVPLNHLLQSDEVLHIVAESGASTLIVDRAVHARVFGGAWPLSIAPRVVFAGPAADAPVPEISLDAMVAGNPVEPARAVTGPDTVCAILYTSGTSGHPKGAIHTSGALLSRKRLAMLYPLLARGPVVMALPLAHIMGLVAMLLTLIAGVPVYFLREFKPLSVLSAIERLRATMFVGVPAMYQLMATFGLDRFDLTSVRAWISASDVMPPELVTTFRRRSALAGHGRWRVPTVFVDAYGSVEAGGAVMARVWMREHAHPDGPAAFVLPQVRVRIRASTGEDVGRGTVGELWIQSPTSFKGYTCQRDAGGDTQQGWVRTGDLASRSGMGLVRFVSRTSDLIKTGGYSVSPGEIERVLAAHDAVDVAVAFGVSDPIKTEVPVAVVTLAEGAHASGEELVEYARRRLAAYKSPRYVFVVPREAIPYTATRKVARGLLASQFAGRVGRVRDEHATGCARVGCGIDVDLPVTLVLGGGGIRGLAHLGVIETLCDGGYRIEEIAGTSVGALVGAFYALVGLTVSQMRDAGMAIGSKHLLIWALRRRAPAWIQRRWSTGGGVGPIPQYLDKLKTASFGRLHHGVQRVGFVALDAISGREIVCHSDAPIVSVSDIVRGSVAIPGLFPARRCLTADGELKLTDGASVLPVEAVFRPPFRPRQVLVVDISTKPDEWERHAREIDRLRAIHPTIPIEIIRPERLPKATVLYRREGLSTLVESGRRAARAVAASGLPADVA